MVKRRPGLGLAIVLVSLVGAPAGGEPRERVERAASRLEGPTPPTVSPARAGGRSLIEAAWQDSEALLPERVEKTRFIALALGAPNVESAARWLIEAGPSLREADAMERARHARKLAPDLPIVHLALADAALQSGLILVSLDSLVAALAAIPRHLEARLWVEGAVGAIATGGLLLGSLFFVCLVGIRAFPAALHDLGDFVWPAMPGFSRAALLAALVGLPLLVGEGVAGLAGALFGVGFVYADRRSRLAILCAVGLFGIGLYGVSERTGRVLSAFDGDSLERAAYAVTRELDSPGDRALLEAAAPSDSVAAHAFALNARRVGDSVVAIRRYEELLTNFPGDPLALANLGNLYFEAGEIEKAIALYQRSVSREPRAVVLFNLSQAHARAFQVADFDRTMARAQELDPEGIAELSRRAKDGFVFDVPLAVDAIYDRMISTSEGFSVGSAVRARLAPGWLGRSWQNGLLAFGGLALLAIFLRGRFEISSACRWCGSRVCHRCDGVVRHRQVCDACYGLFHGKEGTDSRLRERRVVVLRRREQRLEWLRTGLGLGVPGWESLAGGRPLGGLLACLFLAVALIALVWVWTFLPDPLVLGAIGSLTLASISLFGIVAYTSLVLVARIRRDRSAS